MIDTTTMLSKACPICRGGRIYAPTEARVKMALAKHMERHLALSEGLVRHCRKCTTAFKVPLMRIDIVQYRQSNLCPRCIGRQNKHMGMKPRRFRSLVQFDEGIRRRRENK